MKKISLNRAVRSIIALFFLLINHLSFSQKEVVIFNKLDTRRGLSSNFVHDIIADSSGFVWFATSSGLDRYDGTRFKYYKAEPDNPNSLKSNLLKQLVYDRKNRLWIISQTGLSRYVPEYDHFINYNNIGSGSLNELSPSRLFEDSKGNFWLSYAGQADICYFDLNKDTVTYRLSPLRMKKLGIIPDSYLIKCVDANDNIWIGGIKTNTHYYIEKKENDLRIKYTVKGNFRKNIAMDPAIDIIFEDSKGNMYFTNHGLFQVSFDSASIPRFKYIDLFEGRVPSHINDLTINKVTEDESGKLWVSTGNYGVKIFDPVSEDVTPYKPANASALKGFDFVHSNPDAIIRAFPNEVYDKIEPGVHELAVFKEVDNIYNTNLEEVNSGIVKSKDGTYWLNTMFSGVIYFNLYNPQFELYRNETGNENSLGANHIWGICEDHKGRLWVGTNGVDMYDPSTGKFHHFNENTDKYYVDLEGSVPAIFEINPNEFLIAASAYLHWYKYDNGKFIKLGEFRPDNEDSNSLVDWGVYKIFKDSRGVIWIATFNGMSAWSPPDNENPRGQFTNYYYKKNGPKGQLPSPLVWNFFEDSKERLWICTEDMLVSMDSARTNITTICPRLPNGDSIAYCFPECVLEYPKGIFWIATEGYGLFRYDEVKGEYKHYNTTNGLPSDKLYSVLNDSTGKLWLSSGNGLVRFDPGKETIETFTVSDGLQDNLFLSGSYHKGNYSGKFYFGGSNGLNSFYPDKIKTLKFESSVYLSGLRVNNQNIGVGKVINDHIILPKDINYLDEIILKHFQNNFSVDFSSIQFSSPEKTRYKYILEGVDRDWNQVSGEYLSANYSHLKHGNYSFKVKSIGRNGNWDGNEKVIGITILPPWWMTWWAKVIYVLVFVVVIYLLQRYIVLKVNYEKQLELEEAKTNFFMNVSHEFRTPLTLIIDPLDRILSLQKVQPKLGEQLALVQRNAKRLLRLVNQLLDLREPGAGNMRVNMIKGDIKDFLERIFESFRHLAERHKIEYEFCWMENETADAYLYFDPDKLEKIMYNLISNAFKFTHDNGHIIVTIEKFVVPAEKSGEENNVLLQIMVSDSGIGISKEHLPHIFNRFYRVKGRTDKKQNGSGIGLSLTKDLVELLKGKISVTSAAGKGTTFKVLLPCGLIQDLPVEEEAGINMDKKADIFSNQPPINIVKSQDVKYAQSSIENQNVNEKLAIMIVDDNADIRFYIRRELEENYKVIEAGNGEIGLDLALRQAPDLIISDVMMPVMSGIEFCSKIKGNILTSHIPVIMLTARSSENSVIEGLETGSDDYLIKPFSMSVLQLKIKNILNTRSKLIVRYKNEIDAPLENLGLNKVDKDFLVKVEDVVDKNLSDTRLDVVFLGEQLGMSRSHLFKKMKALSGQTPGDFIKTMRLKKAASLINTTSKNITEIAFEMGYSSPSNFSRTFASHFNMSPSEYADKNKNGQIS